MATATAASSGAQRHARSPRAVTTRRAVYARRRRACRRALALLRLLDAGLLRRAGRRDLRLDRGRLGVVVGRAGVERRELLVERVDRGVVGGVARLLGLGLLGDLRLRL